MKLPPWLQERLQIMREAAEDWLGGGRALKLAAGALAAYLIAVVVLGIYWSREPGFLPHHEPSEVPGEVLLLSLIGVTSTVLDKPGGYLGNDIMPPGVWLDNMPAWEQGVLTQARDLVTALRGGLGEDDRSLLRAEARLNFSGSSWAVPSSESEYREAIRYLDRYLRGLPEQGGNATESEVWLNTLNLWLQQVEIRLGQLSRQLTASVGASPSGQPAASGAARTPRLQVDNIFYEARGASWALYHLLGALELELHTLLESPEMAASFWRLHANLEQAQRPLRSPIILNGSGFGILANHSLVMASHISGAAAAVSELRDFLK